MAYSDPRELLSSAEVRAPPLHSVFSNTSAAIAQERFIGVESEAKLTAIEFPRWRAGHDGEHILGHPAGTAGNVIRHTGQLASDVSVIMKGEAGVAFTITPH